MAQSLEQKKRQKTLLGILIAAVIITAFVWYISFQKGPSVEEFISPEERVSPGYSFTEQRLKEVKLDFGILDDALFKSLKSHGVLPVTAGETGRTNPFRPY